MAWQVVVVVAVVVGVGVLLMLGQRRKLGEEWTASIERLETFHPPSRTGGRSAVREEWLRVYYRRDDGRTGKFENSAAAFLVSGQADIKPGDRLVKEKGQYVPRILRGA